MTDPIARSSKAQPLGVLAGSDAGVEQFDPDAERVLLAFMGKPKRRHYSRWRHEKGTIDSHGVGRARGRAAARLIAAHRSEFDLYWVQEQWKIANGDTK